MLKDIEWSEYLSKDIILSDEEIRSLAFQLFDNLSDDRKHHGSKLMSKKQRQRHVKNRLMLINKDTRTHRATDAIFGTPYLPKKQKIYLKNLSKIKIIPSSKGMVYTYYNYSLQTIYLFTSHFLDRLKQRWQSPIALDNRLALLDLFFLKVFSDGMGIINRPNYEIDLHLSEGLAHGYAFVTDINTLAKISTGDISLLDSVRPLVSELASEEYTCIFLKTFINLDMFNDTQKRDISNIRFYRSILDQGVDCLKLLHLENNRQK